MNNLQYGIMSKGIHTIWEKKRYSYHYPDIKVNDLGNRKYYSF